LKRPPRTRIARHCRNSANTSRHGWFSSPTLPFDLEPDDVEEPPIDPDSALIHPRVRIPVGSGENGEIDLARQIDAKRVAEAQRGAILHHEPLAFRVRLRVGGGGWWGALRGGRHGRGDLQRREHDRAQNLRCGPRVA
jgi:hypothetical protein